MPYRRLPNTDKARLRALRTAIRRGAQQTYHKQVITFSTLREAENFLNVFEKQSIMYKQTFENQVNANKKYQQVLSNVRMYISHFIQVFNLSVIRGEIKKENKLLYQLDPDIHNLPDLSTEAAILKWGQNIIKGENERISQGGPPIYNPTIAKVHVHYEMFKEYKSNQRLSQATTNRNWEELVKLREKGDKIILDIWNQVEDFYKDYTPYQKLTKCQKFGLVYYYRKNEKVLTPEDDIVQAGD
ncbi:MAG: hypothetical protein GX361_04670 [Bacteroidales bacterium]|nr:hypothetical protein [Bacteroidales bacterium]